MPLSQLGQDGSIRELQSFRNVLREPIQRQKVMHAAMAQTFSNTMGGDRNWRKKTDAKRMKGLRKQAESLVEPEDQSIYSSAIQELKYRKQRIGQLESFLKSIEGFGEPPIQLRRSEWQEAKDCVKAIAESEEEPSNFPDSEEWQMLVESLWSYSYEADKFAKAELEAAFKNATDNERRESSEVWRKEDLEKWKKLFELGYTEQLLGKVTLDREGLESRKIIYTELREASQHVKRTATNRAKFLEEIKRLLSIISRSAESHPSLTIRSHGSSSASLAHVPISRRLAASSPSVC